MKSLLVFTHLLAQRGRMHATGDHMQAVLLDLERVLGGLPIDRIVKVHRRQVALFTPPVADVADLHSTHKGERERQKEIYEVRQ